MREIGGYIELDTYRLPMLHEAAIALNCGRNALAYLIEAQGIRSIALPYYICDSVIDTCRKYGIDLSFYDLSADWLPLLPTGICHDAWLYLVNYFGQLTTGAIEEIRTSFPKLIVDNTQAYFAGPTPGTHTIYSCRKFFGVADGALLYTDKRISRNIPADESYQRMLFLLGRKERNASEFYGQYVHNNELFASEPIKSMSRLTSNLLHGIDYDFVCSSRSENFLCLHERLAAANRLPLSAPAGAFAYPLYCRAAASVRQQLIDRKIYVPQLWPEVVSLAPAGSRARDYAEHILPLPVDQRYTKSDMLYVADMVEAFLGV